MAGEGLMLEAEDREGIQVVHVTGSWDSTTHGQIRDLLDPMVDQGPVRIVLDCVNLAYVNSTGLLLLARYQRACESSPSFFGVAGLNRRVGRAIDLLGMGDRIRRYASIEEALQAARSL